MSKMKGTIKIMTYNVRGLDSKETEIADLFDKEQIDVAILTETKMTPGKAAPPGWRHLSARTANGRGGVSIVIRKHLTCKLVHKYGNQYTQVVIARVAGLYIAGVYHSPAAPPGLLPRELDDIHRLCNGPAIIMGDMNSRHRSWDPHLSFPHTRGAKLRDWCDRKHWNVRAPMGHTYQGEGANIQNRSTVDIALLRQLKDKETRALPFRGISDHCPTVITVEHPTRKQYERKRITHARRKREDLMAIAAELLNDKHADLLVAIRQAQDPQALERAYEDFCNTALQAFRPTARRSKEAPPLYWNEALTHATKIRSRLYKKWKLTNCPVAKRTYKEHDRETKRMIRREKRRSFQALGEMMQQSPHPEAILARFSKHREERIAKNNTKVYRTVDPRAFTEYIGTKFPVTEAMPEVTPRPFMVSDSFRKEIEQAVLDAPKGKAAGGDEVFAEVLQLTPKRSALFIQELWIKCGQMKYTPKAWRITIWVPIYKSGLRGVISNYRPVALLSHIRKIIEVAINRTIMRFIIFHPTQCGFRSHSGCEQAILRYMWNTRQANYVAILDLKGAYGSIPRHRLLELIDQRIPPNLAAMITAFLTEEECYTIGNPEFSVNIRRGVPEGSPLSPSLFNLVMDTLANQIQRESPDPNIVPNIMFADDVNLQAIQAPSMQSLLHTCSRWAVRNDMTWAPTKSHIIKKRGAAPTPFTLAGTTLGMRTQAKYLGITATLTQQGVDHRELSNRIKKAKAAAASLKELRLMRYMTVRQARNTVRALITSKWSYMAHLIPVTRQQLHRINQIEHQARGFYLRFKHKQALDRVCYAMNAPSAEQTIENLGRSAENRLTRNLQEHTDKEHHPLSIALALEELTALRNIRERSTAETEPARTNRREAWERRRNLRRRIPPSAHHLPFLELKKARDQRCAINWFFGRFPEQMHFRMFKNQKGPAAAEEWKEGMYSLMGKTKWNREETEEFKGRVRSLFDVVQNAAPEDAEAALQEELDELQNYI